MVSIGNSPVLLALCAALLYGIGGPIMKVASNNGATANGLLLMYGVGAALVAVVHLRSEPVLFTSGRGFLLALTVGVVFGLAFRCIALAFGLAGGLLTVVLGLTALYPLVGSGIEMAFMGAAQKVNVLQALSGVSLAILGGFLLSTCTKTVH